jgi:hypothetical protein
MESYSTQESELTTYVDLPCEMWTTIFNFCGKPYAVSIRLVCRLFNEYTKPMFHKGRIRPRLSQCLTENESIPPLTYFKWLKENRISCFRSPLENILSFVLKKGDLEMAKWLIKQNNGRAFGGRVDSAAARYGRIDVLQWLHKKEFLAYKLITCDSHILDCAAIDGHMNVIRWCFELDPNFYKYVTETVLYRMAYSGDLELIQMGIHNHILTRSSYCTSLMNGAAAGGHISILEWFISIGWMPRFTSTLYFHACQHNQLKTIQWIYDLRQSHGIIIPLDDSMSNIAAKNGSLDILEWCFEHYAPITPNISLVATANNHFDILLWCQEHDLIHPMAIQNSAIKGNLKMFQWFLENGYRPNKHFYITAIQVGNYEIIEYCLGNNIWYCDDTEYIPKALIFREDFDLLRRWFNKCVIPKDKKPYTTEQILEWHKSR